VTADGGFLKPLVIGGREICEIDLFQLGYTPDGVLCASQKNGCIASDLFESWTQGVLLPYVDETRSRLEYNGEVIIF
jgi:hypothetical protein